MIAADNVIEENAIQMIPRGVTRLSETSTSRVSIQDTVPHYLVTFQQLL